MYKDLDGGFSKHLQQCSSEKTLAKFLEGKGSLTPSKTW